MSWRKISVDDTEYRWRYGSSFVVVRDATMRTVLRMHTHEVVGMRADEYDRACWKKYGQVTPRHIASVIQSRLHQ